MRQHKYFPFILVALLAFSFSSCFQDLNLEPKYGLNAGTVYENPDNYINVLAKLYAGLSMTGNQGPAGDADISGIDEGFSSYLRVLWNLEEVPTDEAVVGWNDPGLPELNTLEWVATNPWSSAMYYRIFFQITLCNEFIRETDPQKLSDRGFSEADKARIAVYRDEARFLRALSYYHALNLFGDAVPFVTTQDKVGAFFPEPTSRENLFNYIESELLDLEKGLLDPVPGFDAENYARANKAAAWTLLAKLYLNAEVLAGQPRWNDCAGYCQKVIDAGYTLEPEYKNLFLADNHNSQEIIFPVTFDGLRSKTYGGTTFLTHAPVGGRMSPDSFGINTGWAGYRATKGLISQFDAVFFTDDFQDGPGEWNVPANGSWTYDSDAGAMSYNSVAGDYANDGFEIQGAPENNRQIEITFAASKFARFIDTTAIDSLNDGGYLAIGTGSGPDKVFHFIKGGHYSFRMNTGNITSIRFYGKNARYLLDRVNVVYRDQDERFLAFVKGQNYEIYEIGTFTDGYAIAKWRNITSTGAVGSDPTGDFVDTDFPLFRLADVYLMYAEAALHGGGDKSSGLAYINLLRQRAKAPQVSDYDLDFILAERARELYWEGQRRSDLIRFGKYAGDSYLWPWKGGVMEGTAVPDFRKLYPIPEADLAANPNLTQNPGY